jgi:type I restriction enzyme M protein
MPSQGASVPAADDSESLFARVPADGTTIGNGALREILGWPEGRYNAAKEALVANGLLVKGQGRGGTIRRAGQAPIPPSSAKPRKAPKSAVTHPTPAPSPTTVARTATGRRTALTKSELYASLWASCDELRGSMDASQYKDYVLVLLFVKYISDRYAGQPFAPIQIPTGATFADMVALKGTADIGDKINTKILQPLMQANHLSKLPDFNEDAMLGSGKEKVERLSNLIAIFQNPALDFSKNRAEGDDLLGDAYEYLMRHFATESGKSKGQFYTPAEVSRIIAQILGIRQAAASNSTTVYDPTCGSGSLLLKVGAEAAHDRAVRVSLFGQEKDQATAGLARMNMILHDYATAEIVQGNTLANPLFKDGAALKTFDYVVANPPFSDKRWSTGLTPDADLFDRFTAYGVPPGKQGDYAYLLHILRSLRPDGQGACILPHGVLFRGNAEAAIRKNLLQRGHIKGIIGLPANLFFGTGIPACIIVLDKAGAAARADGKGAIFLIDASKGFRKDGPKNRLREQDLHRIVDVFAKQEYNPGYSRLVPISEIAAPKNDYNLNLPRYIDSADAEDLHDIDGHLRGGIPARDIALLEPFWRVLPSIPALLIAPADRPGYHRLTKPITEVKAVILGHPEFAAFAATTTGRFTAWRTETIPRLRAIAIGSQPKALIEAISEALLATFREVPLLDAYDIYQHLMDYWAATMQDDGFILAAEGWQKGAQPREIIKVKNKENKLVWPSEKEDYRLGTRRFKSDLVPGVLLVERFFAVERDAITAIETELSAIEQQMDERREEHGGEEGLLAEVIEGEGDKQKITAKSIAARLREIGNDAAFADERQALQEYDALMDRQSETKARLKAAQEDLAAKLDAKYPTLTEAEVQTLVIDDKWMARLAADIQGEIDRVGATLTGRLRQLAERYADSLPVLTARVAELDAKVAGHLRRMGFQP